MLSFHVADEHRLDHDVLALRDEPPASPASEALLRPVMRSGALLAPHPPLAAIRSHCAAQVAALPDELRAVDAAASYPVHKSERLLSLQRALRAEVEAQEVRRARSASPRPAG